MAPSATGLVGVHGFDLARDAAVELKMLVCECARSEVAQIVNSLRCVSEGAEHSGVNFPGFAVMTKALLNRTGLPARIFTQAHLLQPLDHGDANFVQKIHNSKAQH
jgi:hypothetical protein